MKLALLAAVAVLATPVMAQETPGTAQTGQSMPAGDPSATDTTAMPQSDPSMQQQPMADPGMQQPSGGAMAGGAMASAPTDPNMADPAGGYQPSTTSSGPAQPGAQVTFQPAPSPSQAFPPPPPMKKYPICKKGQYDNCMQRGGR